MFTLRRAVEWQNPIDLRWKLWLTLTVLGLVTINFGGLAWGIQRSMNVVREICMCDLVRMLRWSDVAEGLSIWLTQDKGNELQYFVCRSVCP